MASAGAGVDNSDRGRGAGRGAALLDAFKLARERVTADMERSRDPKLPRRERQRLARERMRAEGAIVESDDESGKRPEEATPDIVFSDQELRLVFRDFMNGIYDRIPHKDPKKAERVLCDLVQMVDVSAIDADPEGPPPTPADELAWVQRDLLLREISLSPERTIVPLPGETRATALRSQRVSTSQPRALIVHALLFGFWELLSLFDQRAFQAFVVEDDAGRVVRYPSPLYKTVEFLAKLPTGKLHPDNYVPLDDAHQWLCPDAAEQPFSLRQLLRAMPTLQVFELDEDPRQVAMFLRNLTHRSLKHASPPWEDLQVAIASSTDLPDIERALGVIWTRFTEPEYFSNRKARTPSGISRVERTRRAALVNAARAKLQTLWAVFGKPGTRVAARHSFGDDTRDSETEAVRRIPYVQVLLWAIDLSIDTEDFINHDGYPRKLNAALRMYAPTWLLHAAEAYASRHTGRS